MTPLTRAQNDPLARARRALDQVDGELDLARLHAVTSGHRRPDPDLLPPADDADPQVEILRSGQRPTQPRRRAAAWALAATVALLCGAGVGTAMLWSDAGETPPGSQVPAPPRPEATEPPRSPEATPTTDSRACSPARPTPSATPREPRPTANERASEACRPGPSDRTEAAP
ncbi:hypothetical protein ACH47X_19045 [Promicromonospora kroppenstedtii]|uniref:Uncharacterized protein n=1 Tax=Promicromonospora kroppenstedtii TaxID=440482 RepID=A0ABW7XNA3_9MICO